jgi:hypothetical protein
LTDCCHRIQRAQREWADRHAAELRPPELEQAGELLRGIREALTQAR